MNDWQLVGYTLMVVGACGLIYVGWQYFKLLKKERKDKESEAFIQKDLNEEVKAAEKEEPPSEPVESVEGEKKGD